MGQFMQIYQMSRVFPHGGQMVNNQTISPGSNYLFSAGYPGILRQLMSVRKGRWV